MSIIGSLDSAENERMVTHVGISIISADYEYGGSAQVWHCQPPVSYSECVAHVNGFVENLTQEEVNRLKTVVNRLKVTMQAIDPGRGGMNHYSIIPANSVTVDHVSGRVRSRKFSCAGYVSHVYSKIDIQLAPPETDLPEISFDELCSHYPDLAGLRLSAKRWGLKGGGPWKVLLAGYLINSLARTDALIRSGPPLITSTVFAEYAAVE